MTLERLIRRDGDAEIVGLLRSHGDGLFIPCGPHGAPLASPMPPDEAELYVHRHGLESLMDTWLFQQGEEQYSCKILEARPGYARYQITDYGHPHAFTTRETRDPANELAWSRHDRP